MKKLFSFIQIFVCCINVSAQTNFNKSWCLGVGYTYNMKFGAGNPQISIYNNTNNIVFISGSSNICDSLGVLVLSSDGMNIYDSLGNLIDNGDSLTSNAYFDYY